MILTWGPMLGLLVYGIQVMLHELVSFGPHQLFVLSIDTRVMGDGLVYCGVYFGVLMSGCTDVV